MPTFISHYSEDKNAYSSICESLDIAKIERWNQKFMSPGAYISEELRPAIQNCEVCVFIATKSSIKRPWCLTELGAFWGAGKSVLIYMAEPDIPESDFPPQFYGTLRVNNIKTLIEGLKKEIVEYHNAHGMSSRNADFFPSSAEYGSEKDWVLLLSETTNHFDLLGLNLDQWRNINRFKEKIIEKANAGCKIRFLLMHQNNQLLSGLFQGEKLESIRLAIKTSFDYFSKLQEEQSNVTVRQILNGAYHFSLTRSDQYMVLTQYLSSNDWGYGPTWKCVPKSPLFKDAMNEFEHLWLNNDPKQKKGGNI